MKTLTVKSNGWYWEFKEGEIRYIGKPINNKQVGQITCYGPDGSDFKPSAKANVIYQKQVYRKGTWINI